MGTRGGESPPEGFCGVQRRRDRGQRRSRLLVLGSRCPRSNVRRTLGCCAPRDRRGGSRWRLSPRRMRRRRERDRDGHGVTVRYGVAAPLCPATNRCRHHQSPSLCSERDGRGRAIRRKARAKLRLRVQLPASGCRGQIARRPIDRLGVPAARIVVRCRSTVLVVRKMESQGHTPPPSLAPPAAPGGSHRGGGGCRGPAFVGLTTWQTLGCRSRAPVRSGRYGSGAGGAPSNGRCGSLGRRPCLSGHACLLGWRISGVDDRGRGEVMTDKVTRVVLVGYGYWGANLARNLVAAPSAKFVGVADADEGQRRRAEAAFPGIRTWTSLDEVLDESDVDAIVLATPAHMHASMAVKVLLSGRHVMVEKPLAMNPDDAWGVVRAADETGLVAMVGHTFLYSPPV